MWMMDTNGWHQRYSTALLKMKKKMKRQMMQKQIKCCGVQKVGAKKVIEIGDGDVDNGNHGDDDDGGLSV